MRLKKLWVSKFKNLEDFTINFEHQDGITVLIGNNASGKSNVLEAISSIFSHIYKNTITDTPFNFYLEYSIGEINIQIKKTNAKVEIKIKDKQNKKWKNITNLHSFGSVAGIMRAGDRLSNPYDYRPSQVIALYSGEESRLWEDYYSNFYIDFFNSIKNQYKQTPNLLYINKYVWNIGFIALLCNEPSQNFIRKNFDINPDDGINIEFTIDDSKYRKFSENKAIELINRIKSETTDGVINSKTLGSFDIGSKQITPKEIFEYLYITSLPTKTNQLTVNIEKIITEISLNVNKIPIRDFSEGQKKQILLSLTLDVLADGNALLLFDEPDAHIHIGNKKLIPNMLKKYGGSRNIVLTTHSPTLAHSFEVDNLIYIENGKINQDYNDREKVLNKLSGGLMDASEKQLLLQSDKDILIVEGKTDGMYINTALEKLKKDNDKYENLEFQYLYLGGSDKDMLESILNTFKPKENQKIIAFLDNDNAGWSCIEKTITYQGNKDEFKLEKLENGSFVCFYP